MALAAAQSFGNLAASGWRRPSGRVGQLPAGRKPQMGAGRDAARLPAAHPRHEPLHRKARPMSQQLTVPIADTQLHIVDTPTASQRGRGAEVAIRRFDHDQRTGIERRSTPIP